MSSSNERDVIRSLLIRSKTAIEECHLPVILHKRTGEIIFVSKGWIELSGYPAEDIPTVQAWMALANPKRVGSSTPQPKSDIESFLAHLYDMDLSSPVGEWSLVCRGGSTRIWDFYFASLGPWVDGDNVFLSIGVDITDSKHFEALSRAILESVADGVVTIGSGGAIVGFNSAAERLFGYTADEIQGRNVSLLMPEPHRSRHQTYVEKYIETGESQILGSTRDVLCLRKDGTLFAAELSVTESDVPGEKVFVGTIRDVTKKRADDNHLRSVVDKLRRSNSDLEQFVHVTSHDLKEPLRMITAYLGLLASRYHDVIDDKGRGYVEFAREGAKRMQEAIEGLLDYSRAGTRAHTHDEVDLNFVMAEVLQDLSVRIAESCARITIDPLPTLVGDGVQLRHVFQNLLSNALKFQPFGQTPDVRVWAESVSGGWKVSVKDNGIGIASDQIPRLFGIFQRLNPRRLYAGSGIGLAICKRIVERHGGFIEVESTPDGGSTFIVFLPSRAVGASDG